MNRKPEKVEKPEITADTRVPLSVAVVCCSVLMLGAAWVARMEVASARSTDRLDTHIKRIQSTEEKIVEIRTDIKLIKCALKVPDDACVPRQGP